MELFDNGLIRTGAIVVSGTAAGLLIAQVADYMHADPYSASDLNSEYNRGREIARHESAIERHQELTALVDTTSAEMSQRYGAVCLELVDEYVNGDLRDLDEAQAQENITRTGGTPCGDSPTEVTLLLRDFEALTYQEQTRDAIDHEFATSRIPVLEQAIVEDDAYDVKRQGALGGFAATVAALFIKNIVQRRRNS